MNTSDEKNETTNIFFTKFFERVDGLQSILVTDNDGTLLTKAVAPNAKKSDFGLTLPATFIIVGEQVNKLKLGNNDSVITYYKNYVVVHFAQLGLLVTLIGTKDTNVQLLLELKPQLLTSKQNLIELPENMEKSILDTLEKWKKQQSSDEAGVLYLESEDDTPWVKDFAFDSNDFLLTFYVDLTFMDNFEIVSIQIPKEYPNGEYKVEKGGKPFGIFKGKDLCEVLDTLFDKLEESRDTTDFEDPQLSSPSENSQHGWDESPSEFGGFETDRIDNNFIKQAVDTEINDWIKSCNWSKSSDYIITTKDIDFVDRKINMLIRGQNEKEYLPFAIHYSEAYFTGIDDFKLQVSTSDKRLNNWCQLLNFLLDGDITQKSSSITIPGLLTKALEIYNRCVSQSDYGSSQQKPWYDRIDEENSETKEYYLRVWGSTPEVIKNELPNVVNAKKAILKQLNRLKDTKKDGYSIRTIGNNIFVWEVKIFGFDKESFLGKDLDQHALKFSTGNTDIVLEVMFTAHFPKEPPFVRVVRPRLHFPSGGVAFSGIFPFFTDMSAENWTKDTNLSTLFLHIRQTLIDNNARVDLRTPKVYDKKYATRLYNHGKNKKHVKYTGFESQFSVYSNSYSKMNHKNYITPRHNPEGGNNILLPRSAAKHVQGTPIQLEITAGSTTIYCGLLEFVAEEGCAILPDWMMKHFYIPEGTKATIKTVKLPLGELCLLQPHSKEFYNMKSPELSLTNVLQNYTTLQDGQTIPIMDGNNVHLVEVVECKPSPAICIDVEKGKWLNLLVDFLPALDYEEEKSTKTSQEKSTIQNASMYIQSEEEFQKFLESTKDPNSGGHVLGTGKPDDKSKKPEQKQEKKSNEKDEKNDLNGGRKLGDAKLPDADSVTCSNCQRNVPKDRLQMHLRHCQRYMYRCKKCGEVMKNDQKNNHEATAHKQVKCECGKQLENYMLEEHKKQCPAITVKCKHCGLQLSAQKMKDHEPNCKKDESKTSQNDVPMGGFVCTYCNKGKLTKQQLIDHIKALHPKDPDQLLYTIQFL